MDTYLYRNAEVRFMVAIDPPTELEECTPGADVAWCVYRKLIVDCEECNQVRWDCQVHGRRMWEVYEMGHESTTGRAYQAAMDELPSEYEEDSDSAFCHALMNYDATKGNGGN